VPAREPVVPRLRFPLVDGGDRITQAGLIAQLFGAENASASAFVGARG
jgi:hypothetical protein